MKRCVRWSQFSDQFNKNLSYNMPSTNIHLNKEILYVVEGILTDYDQYIIDNWNTVQWCQHVVSISAITLLEHCPLCVRFKKKNLGVVFNLISCIVLIKNWHPVCTQGVTEVKTSACRLKAFSKSCGWIRNEQKAVVILCLYGYSSSNVGCRGKLRFW